MSWEFSTDEAFQETLTWMDTFVREEIEPIDLVFPKKAYHPLTETLRQIVDPLKDAVRARGLWACHLGPELGGQGFGQVKLSLMNEILGRSIWAPIVFGTQAPDTGNAEIIAHYGTDAQKERYLEPLLGGEIFSCYSMTEPQGGSDPSLFTTSATPTPTGWVIEGRKFFSSNARTASFFIVMAVTDPDVDVYHRMSMFLIPKDTPGVVIERNIGLMGEPATEEGMHALIRYDNVVLPKEALLGGVGEAFAIAQTRLGGGRIHHAMRTVGMVRQAFDMMCERAVSRQTKDGPLSSKQSVRDYVAETYIELTQFRLFVLYVAWQIDSGMDRKQIRQDIAAIKVLTPQILHNAVAKAIQVHGALGVSNEMPLGQLWMAAPIMGLVDGPTEVHKSSVARAVLSHYEPIDSLWPSAYLPERKEAALQKFANFLEHKIGNQ